jgi:hypothetical protein
MADGGARPRPGQHGGGELVGAVSGLLLLATMFGLKWYGVAAHPSAFAARSASPTAENAWNGLLTLRWLMLLTVFVAVGSLAIRITQRRHGTKTNTGIVVATLGTITALLLTFRVLIALPSPTEVTDQKIGAVLGLLCAVAVALGGFESIRDQRARAQATVRRSRVSPAADAR